LTGFAVLISTRMAAIAHVTAGELQQPLIPFGQR
jgi:hypothetical protein